ncbi:MAG: D-alanyl-D-alanine carboxypeptidase, partial [Polaromonas sp.]
MLFPFPFPSATVRTCNHARGHTRLTQCLLAGLVALIGLDAGAQSLPPEVEALLARAKVPREAFAAVVVDAAPALNGKAAPLLSYRAGSAMNPASVMKLVTTYAGLELLGPAYTWATPVYTDGPVADGVLNGNLVIQGGGDPKLVMERLWLLLRRVQGLGIKTISGDIVLDRSAFAASAQNPGDFDGEALRPYNVQPDALLVNYKSVVMTFVPNPGNGSASIRYDPPLAGVQMQASVPLSAGSNGRAALGDCGDYRAQLQPDLADPLRMAFAGSYPAACGEKVWAIAYPDPAGYAARAMAGLWREMGGTLDGRVREGTAPSGLKPAFEMESPSLAEV